jgi:hypothetical protein
LASNLRLGFRSQPFELYQKPFLGIGAASDIRQEQAARDEKPISAVHVTTR